MVEAEQSWETPKKQRNPSPRNPFGDLPDDRLRVQPKVEGRRGSSSSSSSGSSSILGHSATGGPPSSGNLDQWEHLGGSGGGKVAGVSGPGLAETHHRCKSPDLGYSSMVKAYSNLSLLVPQSPGCFMPADLRAGPLLSDCSSEGSVSSDSFSPDLMLDDIPKCHHHHHHHHCSGQYAHPVSHGSPGLGQRTPYSYPVSPALRRQRGLEDSPLSVTSHSSPNAFKPPLAYIPPHPPHPLLSSCPGEFQTFPSRPPQTSTVHGHSQSSSIAHKMMGSPWQDGSLPDSQMYKGSPLRARQNHPELNQQPQHQTNWDPHYEHSPKPCYDLFSVPSLSEVHETSWPSPWGRQVHSTPRGFSALSHPPHSQLPLPSVTPHKSHLPSVHQHQEPPVLGRYQDHRERVFINLCRIFSPDLVRMVMTRNPHVMDAQELAAAIIMEKSQHGSWTRWRNSRFVYRYHFCRIIPYHH